MGMNSVRVRVPVLWERLQPIALGPLNAAKMVRLEATLVQLSGFKQIIVDVRNYARSKDKSLSRGDLDGVLLKLLPRQIIWLSDPQRMSR